MKLGLALAFLLAAGGAAVSALWRDVAETADELRRELRTAHQELDGARAELRRIQPDRDALRRDVLGPSVQVSTKGGVGGGTLFSSRDGRSWVVSAWHVLRKGVREGRPVEVKLYGPDGAPAETHEAEVAEKDESKDLALLRLKTDRALPSTARLAPRASLRDVRVFAPVYAVGCPLGHDPLPTPGEVATLSKEVGGERFWMMNAPTTFGNSGGGVFLRESRELIGVSVMVCTIDGAASTPVPHLGILVPLDAVYDWLDELGYANVYDPAAPPPPSTPSGPGEPSAADDDVPAPAAPSSLDR
jgi:S1-C subfamily serine protease